MVLFNYGVLTAGFDEPRTRCVIIGRPTTSLVLYSQMVGRAMRGAASRRQCNRSNHYRGGYQPSWVWFRHRCFFELGGIMDDQLANLGETDRDLFPGSFTIRALRDSRYHNTAYAVAELIDNSIEAYAERIDLLCLENHVEVKSQTRSRLVELAVLDNGEGMTPRILLDALKFGGGTRHDSTQGIGKYGMGLPTSSMSQCTRVDVWTWQAGHTLRVALWDRC